MIVIRATDEANLVRQLLPMFAFGEDNDGQLVIYTDHQFGHAGDVVPFAYDYEEESSGRAPGVDDGLCQTCGLEAYDPDCGCICDCHHTCE